MYSNARRKGYHIILYCIKLCIGNQSQQSAILYNFNLSMTLPKEFSSSALAQYADSSYKAVIPDGLTRGIVILSVNVFYSTEMLIKLTLLRVSENNISTSDI